MNQYEKADTAAKFVAQYGGRWGFDGRDMMVFLHTKKAIAAAKRLLPFDTIRMETPDGKPTMICRF
jgi:hypothetical protein